MPRRCVTVVLSFVFTAIVPVFPAAAQDGPVDQPSTVAALPEKADDASVDPYKRFDDLSLKGWSTPYPRIADTILQDKGGIRSALADHGIGFLGLSANGSVVNIGKSGPSGQEYYNGQKSPTLYLSVHSFFLNYDASRIGLKGGQFFANVTATTNEFQSVDGPRDVRLSNLGYFQSLFDDAVQIKLGYFDNAQEYAGTSVGGSIASGNLGPQARIPVQAGLSYSAFGTPAVNVRLNFKGGFYTKFGVQRSTPPGGARVEKMFNGSPGLKFSVPGARALFIDELGYKVNAEPGRKSTWVRAGGLYNTTRYPSLVDGRPKENWAIYAAVDQQIVQSDAKMPFQGVYLGATFNAARDEINLYTRYFEARAYGIGLFPSRPFDLSSLVLTYNGLSKAAVRSLAKGQPADDHIITAIGSHAFQVRNGLYLQSGLGLTVNPVFTPKLPNAINLFLGLTVLL